MKNIVFKIIIVLFCFQSGIIQPIDLPWYQKHFTKNNAITYALNCSTINIAENIRSLGLVAYHRLTHKKTDLYKVIDAIKKELAEIESWMLQLEQEALLAIKEKYQISDKIWQKYKADVHRMKTIYAKSMQQHHDIIHDPDIPADILEIVITTLQHNNINPQSINIKMVSDQEEIDKNPYLLAQARTQAIPLCVSENSIISYKYIPLTIELFPAILKSTMVNKIALCAHETQHLLQHHGLTDLLLITYLHYYYDVEATELQQTPEYQKLAQIHEAQAEILSAIKDPHIAECMKIMRQTSYYPEYLYEDHFFYLAYINKLWKIHEWMKFFHHDGLIKIKNEWIDKIKMCADSLQQLNEC